MLFTTVLISLYSSLANYLGPALMLKATAKTAFILQKPLKIVIHSKYFTEHI